MIEATNEAYQIDVTFLDGYGAEVGPFGIAVYNALARFARDGKGEFFVASQGKIADMTGMARKQVNRQIKSFRQLGLVNTKRLRTGYLLYQLCEPHPRPQSQPEPEPPEELPPCLLCGATEEIVCHHVKGRKVDANDIIHLCAECHHQIHHGDEH